MTEIDNKVKILREFIKFIASTKGLTLNNLVEKLHTAYNRKPNVPNFTAKLRRGSLTIKELLEISSILDYEFIKYNIEENNSKRF